MNQIQVKSDIGLDFAASLRSILRHDPDIIMVGEIRDRGNGGDIGAFLTNRASRTLHLAYQ